MASNKAATAIYIAAFAMIFAVEVALGVFTDHHTNPPPCAGDSVGHYKVNGYDLKMEKGHEACYIACYKNVFVSGSSPSSAEKRCHKRCSSGRGVSLFSGAIGAAHTISSSVIPQNGIFDTSGDAEKPDAFSCTNAAAEKPAVSSTGAAAEKPAVSSTDTTTEKPAISSTGTAIEKPAISSTGTAAERPVVSSAGTVAEAPAVWSTNTEETNFGNPYS